MLKIKTILCLALIFASLSGCKKDEENMLMPGDATIGDPYNFPYMSNDTYTIEKISGDNQLSVPGVELPEPVKIRITNKKGDPVSGIPIKWGWRNEIVRNASSETDANGFAQAYWTPEKMENLSVVGDYYLHNSLTAMPTIHPDIEVIGVNNYFTTNFKAEEIAGGDGAGNNGYQLNSPQNAFVDLQGNVYVADKNNHRITKWKSGSPNGSGVAASGGAGNYGYNLLSPSGVFIDAAGNIYVADTGNNRIQKFSPNGNYGTTVVGGFNNGTVTAPHSVWVDAQDNIFVLERSNNRIMKFGPGATSGVIVAGGNGAGSGANQLNYPSGYYIDAAGNIYIADTNNRRIQKWAPGATEGVTVLGGFAAGSATEYKFEQPKGIWVDAAETIYVADAAGNTTKWAPGATKGEIKGVGGDALWVDQQGNLYVTETQYHRVLKWAP